MRAVLFCYNYVITKYLFFNLVWTVNRLIVFPESTSNMFLDQSQFASENLSILLRAAQS